MLKSSSDKVKVDVAAQWAGAFDIKGSHGFKKDKDSNEFNKNT